MMNVYYQRRRTTGKKKKKKKREQSVGIWQSKHITDKEKMSQSIRQAKTKANNLNITFTSKKPIKNW